MANHSNKKPYLVGIAGGSASGKTSFIKKLVKRLPINSLSLISQDNYYLPKEQQLVDENGQINFDLPTAINRRKLFSDLMALMDGKPILQKEYTFNTDREPEMIEVHSAPVIVVEGLFVFYYEEIRKMLDLQVYLDVREDVKLKRRILRDSVERGYPEHAVRYQWDNHVMPSYKKFLKPFRDDSDVIITNNTTFDKGLEVIISHLLSKV